MGCDTRCFADAAPTLKSQLSHKCHHDNTNRRKGRSIASFCPFFGREVLGQLGTRILVRIDVDIGCTSLPSLFRQWNKKKSSCSFPDVGRCRRSLIFFMHLSFNMRRSTKDGKNLQHLRKVGPNGSPKI